MLIISATITAYSQHYVGVKNAYGITGVMDDPDINSKTINSTFNPGIVHRYEHKNYFAIQTEFNHISKGFHRLDINKETGEVLSDTTHKISAFQLPFTTQIFYRFGWFRPYVAGGAYLGYISNRKVEYENISKDYIWDNNDKRFEYGIIGGAGMAFTISRFELQAEWRYEFSFSFLRKPHINGISQYLNSNQMMISLTLLYRLGK